MIFIPCPPPFDVSYVGPRLIIESKDHLTHPSSDGDSSYLINQPLVNIDIPLINPSRVNQYEPLDD